MRQLILVLLLLLLSSAAYADTVQYGDSSVTFTDNTGNSTTYVTSV